MRLQLISFPDLLHSHVCLRQSRYEIEAELQSVMLVPVLPQSPRLHVQGNVSAVKNEIESLSLGPRLQAIRNKFNMTDSPSSKEQQG